MKREYPLSEGTIISVLLVNQLVVASGLVMFYPASFFFPICTYKCFACGVVSKDSIRLRFRYFITPKLEASRGLLRPACFGTPTFLKLKRYYTLFTLVKDRVKKNQIILISHQRRRLHSQLPLRPRQRRSRLPLQLPPPRVIHTGPAV